MRRGGKRKKRIDPVGLSSICWYASWLALVGKAIERLIEGQRLRTGLSRMDCWLQGNVHFLKEAANLLSLDMNLMRGKFAVSDAGRRKRAAGPQQPIERFGSGRRERSCSATIIDLRVQSPRLIWERQRWTFGAV